MKTVVFEDAFVPRLHPITLSRPAYAISCGSFRLVDWLRGLEVPCRGLVRDHLAETQAADYSDLATKASDGDTAGGLLLVNARTVPSVAASRQLHELAKHREDGIVLWKNQIAAARLQADRASKLDLSNLTPDNVTQQLQELELDEIPVDVPLFEYPHDVVRYNMEVLPDSLEYRLSAGGYSEIADGVFGKPGTVIGEHVVIDTKEGPILLDEDASIGSFCLLRGPAHVGRGSKLIEHAAIKDGVTVGHTTKIGGEVEASVIEAFTNKQHHGFLGHSYLGSWINLGAGTCNSDLKNTYGKVNMQYGTEKVSTGMQFVGCIMGDYSKTAINTGIFTGKVIGVCSMLYGFVTTNVPSYVNYARLFGQVTELPPEVMVATQQRMFQRRGVEPRECDRRLLHDMYRLTAAERQLVGEPLSL